MCRCVQSACSRLSAICKSHALYIPYFLIYMRMCLNIVRCKCTNENAAIHLHSSNSHALLDSIRMKVSSDATATNDV